MGRENANDRRQTRVVRQEKKATKEAKKVMKDKSAEERAKALAEEEDLDAIIAQFEVESKKRTKVEVKVCDQPPKPRINFTFVAHPSKDELCLFGGEYYNGASQFVYGDFFIFTLKKNEWRQIISPNSPPPRCGHASAIRGRNGGEMYIYGGEYASRNQDRFKHYSDLWVYYFAESAWEKIEVPGGPTARSGHRMTIIGSYLVVFGGYYDNGKGAPKYYNDVYTFHLEDRVWTKVSFPSIMIGPTPRSACQFMPASDEKILLFGGYSRHRVKGEIDKGETHSDIWSLEIDHDVKPIDSKKGEKKEETRWKWTRVRPNGIIPSSRNGSVMVARPGTKLLYSFGGVTDMETEETLQGSFMNDLFSFGLDNDHWSPVTIKTGMKTKMDQEEIEQEKREKLKQEMTAKRAAKKALKASKSGKASKLPVVPLAEMSQLKLKDEMKPTV
eukprot:Ihof_evm2s428 gene=Ihof_evmTU2s428